MDTSKPAEWAKVFDAIADELELAVAHCKTAAGHYRDENIPRGASTRPSGSCDAAPTFSQAKPMECLRAAELERKFFERSDSCHAPESPWTLRILTLLTWKRLKRRGRCAAGSVSRFVVRTHQLPLPHAKTKRRVGLTPHVVCAKACRAAASRRRLQRPPIARRRGPPT